MHKWYHLFSIDVDSWTSRSTSYCGRYLWHYVEIYQEHCKKCNHLKAEIFDHKTGLTKKLDWAPYSETYEEIKKYL